jgi:hypothetical protein
MLTINEKIIFFKQKLLIQNGSYADTIRNEVYEYFFERIGDSSDIENFSFLNTIVSSKEIEEKVDLIVSKIIMHQHHAGIEDLINEYVI